ncbi:MAG: hypothetical protein JXX28_12275 [Deltaproteobacteria bacterium]|nr:hypothetical protein [Deltaproteobacteria bacterium]
MDSTDIAKTGWASITVSVAWTLATNKFRVESEVLKDLRDHVLLHLDPSVPLQHAEDQAQHLAREFVAKAQRRPHATPWAQDASMPLSPRWHKALEASLSSLSRAVFRQHYGNGRPLEGLEEALQVDLLTLEMARSGLREVIRDAAIKDEVPMEDWPAERMDALLQRLAAYSPGPCPPLAEVIDGLHPEHLADCPRCNRANRLIREGLLQPAELRPTPQPRPAGQVQVMALHFHPDGKRHLPAVAAEYAGGRTQALDGDLLLMEWSEPEEGRAVLRLAAELESPRREHLRGALLQGPGRWSRWGLLGPLGSRAREEVKTRSWGAVDGIGELPGPLPPPPSSRWWWAGVGLVTALSGVLIGAMLLSPAPNATPLEVQFTPGREGLWVAFDTEDTATVALVSLEGGHLQLRLQGESPVEKAEVATGDGSYRTHVQGEGALVVSAPGVLGDLPALIERSQRSDRPLEALAGRIRARYPEAQIATWIPEEP